MSDIIERLHGPDGMEAGREILRLREENARYKLTYAKYVEAADRMNGTPCEQIRHQQEVEALREENARLQAQRKKDKRLNHETESGLLEENVRLREENARLREERDLLHAILTNVSLSMEAFIREGGKEG